MFTPSHFFFQRVGSFTDLTYSVNNSRDVPLTFQLKEEIRFHFFVSQLLLVCDFHRWRVSDIYQI